MRIRLVTALLAVAAAAVITPAVFAPAAAAAPTPPATAAAAREPVVIVPGMLGTGPGANVSYVPTAAKLRSQGFDTTIYTDPLYGLGDITENAGRLKVVIDGVLRRTGAAKVNLVAHSQGGLVSRAYIKYHDGAGSVRNLITLASTHHGTALANLARIFLIDCLGFAGCAQQAIGSEFLANLNAGDDSIGDVRHTAIATRYDQVVIPYTSGFLDAADGNITNVDVQAHCPLRFPGHLAIIVNGAVLDGVLDALRGQPVRLNCAAIV